MTVLLAEQIPTLTPLMQAVEDRLRQVAADQGGDLGACAGHVIRAGGKRLRPLLVILCSGSEDPACQPVIDTAVAAELIHTASLIHDDILDGAGARRGVPTLNRLRGNHTAVLTGDHLFATAFGLLANQRHGILALMTGAVRAMCEAEIEQKDTLFQFSVTEDTYLSRIAKKTASLLAACCGAGALAGGLLEESVAALTEYGRNLGLCFQITDDLLDFTANSSTLGKPAGSDLAQGILTLPVIYLMQEALRNTCDTLDSWNARDTLDSWNARDTRDTRRNAFHEQGRDLAAPPSDNATADRRERLREIAGIARAGGCSESDLEYIRQSVCGSPALGRAARKARQFAGEAVACLGAVPFEAVRAALRVLVEQLLERRC